MVWTKITRWKYRRDRLRYASLLSGHCLSQCRHRRPRETDLKSVVNAILVYGFHGLPRAAMLNPLPAISSKLARIPLSFSLVMASLSSHTRQRIFTNFRSPLSRC